MISTTRSSAMRRLRLVPLLILIAPLPGCSTLFKDDGTPDVAALAQKNASSPPLPDPPSQLANCLEKAGFKPKNKSTAEFLRALAAENDALRICVKAWPDWYNGVRHAANRDQKKVQ